MPRANDFDLAAGKPVAGFNDWDELGPEKLFNFLRFGPAGLDLAASNVDPSDSYGSEPAPAPNLASSAAPDPRDFSPIYPDLPKGAVQSPAVWSDGAGKYQWDAPQVAIDRNASVRSCPRTWCSSPAVAEPLATRAFHMAP